jgi:hypothetical protein
MASTSHTDTPKEAPWRATFLEHVNSMDSPEFVFASLAPATSSSSPTPYVPRARFCIFRGLWAELPENKHNNAPKNERVYQSDMPTFTTDVRMQKVWELFASSPGKAEDVSQVQGSGGGGPCEVSGQFLIIALVSRAYRSHRRSGGTRRPKFNGE